MAEAVRVVVRCRPANKREIALKCRKIVKIVQKTNSVVLMPAEEGDGTDPKSFVFDAVFDDDSTQVRFASL